MFIIAKILSAFQRSCIYVGMHFFSLTTIPHTIDFLHISIYRKHKIFNLINIIENYEAY